MNRRDLIAGSAAMPLFVGNKWVDAAEPTPKMGPFPEDKSYLATICYFTRKEYESAGDFAEIDALIDLKVEKVRQLMRDEILALAK